MNTRTLFIAASLLALFSAPAFADGLTKEDRAALEQMKAYTNLPEPSPDDTVGDALAKADLANSELDIKETELKPKENIKYIYNGTAEITLGHPIRDYRIDDGYVQGLLMQRDSE